MLFRFEGFAVQIVSKAQFYSQITLCAEGLRCPFPTFLGFCTAEAKRGECFEMVFEELKFVEQH